MNNKEKFYEELGCNDLCYLESKNDAEDIYDAIEDTRRVKNCPVCKIK